eukprot:scaffold827_cov76-Cylindrotheca_fusiformis.AAC.2
MLVLDFFGLDVPTGVDLFCTYITTSCTRSQSIMRYDALAFVAGSTLVDTEKSYALLQYVGKQDLNEANVTCQQRQGHCDDPSKEETKLVVVDWNYADFLRLYAIGIFSTWEWQLSGLRVCTRNSTYLYCTYVPWESPFYKSVRTPKLCNLGAPNHLLCSAIRNED